jgi:Zn-dependent hydrolases, including glyoxylases
MILNRRQMFSAGLSLAGITAMGLGAQACAQQGLPPVKATDLGAGLFVLEGAGGHVGVSVGKDGVFVIDSQYAPIAPKLIEKISELSPEPIKLLLNTHWHGDHVGGNAVFKAAGAEIMAHKNVLTRVSAPQAWPTLGFPDAEPIPVAGRPTRLLDDEGLVFKQNGQTILVKHEPTAHTDGDVWVYFVEADVIHAGDLSFHQIFPFIDVDTGGTIDGYIAGQEAIIAAAGPATKIITGHVKQGGNPVTNRDGVAGDVALLKSVRAKMAKVVADGMSLEQALAAKPIAEEAKTLDWRFITEERMVRLVYADLKRQLG